MTDTTADLRLDRWLTATRDACAYPSFTVLAAEADRRDEAVATVAGALPAQYVAPERARPHLKSARQTGRREGGSTEAPDQVHGPLG